MYNLIKAIDALQVTVDKLPLTQKTLEWSFGAAPYTRWSEHEMKVPCTQEKTQAWTLNGWPSAPFTWTEITSCEWGPTKIPRVPQELYPLYQVPLRLVILFVRYVIVST